MRVYHPLGKPHSLFVSPAADPRAVAAGVDSDWVEADGKPRLILVQFGAGGAADVPDALGRYLVATKQASRLMLSLKRLAA